MNLATLLAVIPPPPGDKLELGPFTVHYYGIAIAIGALVAVTLLRRRFAARGGDPDLADRTAVWAVAAGLLGARLAYVSTHLDRFTDRPWAMIAIWEGGLAFFGGLTLGALTAIWYLRRNGAKVPDFVDAAAPCLPLAHAIGRWGNYFNEELYGTVTGVPWALDLSFQAAHVHPTFLYESLLNFTLAGTLLLVDRGRRLKRGSLVFFYLAGYGVIRFCMELIRTDTEWRLFGLSRNAYVALLVVLIGLAGRVWWQRRPEPVEPVAEEPVAEASDAVAEPYAEAAAQADVEPVTDPEGAHTHGADDDPQVEPPPSLT